MIGIILVDQLTKGAVQSNFYLGESVVVIDGFFNLTFVTNSGAAFGFGGQFNDWIRYVLFLFVPVVACLGIFYWLIKTISGPLHMSIAYALILGGAVGNLIDRFSLNYVVDFFDFYYGSYHFATFNVADSAITVAGGILVVDYLLQLKNNYKAKKNKTA
jgi:signal peptidase II